MISIVDCVQPSKKNLRLTFDCFAILMGSIFIAFLSQISIPLSFSPVPLTFQTLAILLVGGILGSKRGALSVATYIFEGCLGIPVFAGGTAGIAKLIGPTGGYLLGFIFCSFIVGFFLERGWKDRFVFTFIAMTIGSLVMLFFGAFWLSFYVGKANAFSLGVYPFLVGDIIKIGTAALMIPNGWKAIHYFK
jgi:biotin transport system substrate-specific component